MVPRITCPKSSFCHRPPSMLLSTSTVAMIYPSMYTLVCLYIYHLHFLHPSINLCAYLSRALSLRLSKIRTVFVHPSLSLSVSATRHHFLTCVCIASNISSWFIGITDKRIRPLRFVIPNHDFDNKRQRKTFSEWKKVSYLGVMTFCGVGLFWCCYIKKDRFLRYSDLEQYTIV